jgi:hypothetical protein
MASSCPALAYENVGHNGQGCFATDAHYLAHYLYHVHLGPNYAQSHLLLQMLALATYFPAGTALVSGYESSSTDTTPQWLELMQGLLDLAGVPSRIVAKVWRGAST